MKDVIKTTAVIIGTMIGGGFISGQEIYIFFNKYEEAGILGIFVSLTLISFIIYKTYKITEENNINNYEEFLNSIIPGKNKNLKQIIKNIINIFLLLSFLIMCNAFSTYCYEIYKIPLILGGILVSILAYVILIRDMKAVIKINEVLMPVIILFIIVMAMIFLKKINTYISYENKAIIKGILYANYNCIIIIPMIVNLKNQIKNENNMKKIIISTFGIMVVLSILIFEMQSSIELEKPETPLLMIAKQISFSWLLTYGFITQIAIFTSAISAGYSLISNFKTNKKRLAFIICILAIPFSILKFSQLVNLVYPVFGLLGALQIFFLIKA